MITEEDIKMMARRGESYNIDFKVSVHKKFVILFLYSQHLKHTSQLRESISSVLGSGH